MGHGTRAVLLASGAAAVIATIAACGSSSSSAQTTVNPTVTVTRSGATATSPAGITACHTANLSLTLGTSDGAAGHVYLPLILTNTGSAPCTVTGYPGVSFVAGSDNHQVGNAAQRDANRTPTTLTLQPGGKATTTVGVAQAGNYDAATCTPTAVTGFRIYPPDEVNSAIVPYTGTGCASTGVTILTVTPLVAS